VKDQSHKDEMSAALRGDFERLRERGVAATLSPAEPDPPAEPEPLAELRLEEPADEVDGERPGLLGRLLGR
jgi:hypothetical protein